MINPFTELIDWVEDYPELGMICAIATPVLCAIAVIVWGN